MSEQPSGAPRRVVRPYVLTRGRTSATRVIELDAPVVAAVSVDQLPLSATPEDRRIVELCATPMSVAELSARIRTPLGVVKILVSDLADHGVLQVRTAAAPGSDADPTTDVTLLERLLEGIRGL